MVIEDRVEKEKARRQAEQEAEELRMTIKVRTKNMNNADPVF